MKANAFKTICLILLISLLSLSLLGCLPSNNNTEENISAGEKPPVTDTPNNSPDSGKTEEPLTPLIPAVQYNLMICAKTNGLNIRTAPKTTASSLGQININDMVQYVGKTGDWYITKHKNQTAYISANTRYTEIKKFKKSNANIEKIFNVGLPLLGIKYVYGAERYHWGNGQLNSNFSITQFDCSSFTQYIYYKSHKVLLNTTSRTQSEQGQYVSKNQLKRGDIMFFTNSSRYHLTGIERVGHVGIYFGDNYILHTASDYSVVEFINNSRWQYYLHSRRVVW